MFQGLTERSVDFLWELALHNERPWFQAHKEEFEAVLRQPFRELAQEVLGMMQEKLPAYDLQLHISRIYRDARRLFGRGPYQDNLWFSLQKGDTRSRGPLFWFELGKDGTSHGVGFWDCSPQQAERFRKKIDAAPARFEGIIGAIPCPERLKLWGEEYKRPKADRGPLLNPWYNRKSVSAGYENSFGPRLFSQELPALLTESFLPLLPLYDFLLEVYNQHI